MGMTALRNKRGIMAGDHTGKVGPGAGGPPDAATLKRISEIARTQGPDAAHAAVGKMAGPQAQQAVQQAGQTMAPRYQKMLADGVDPQVVAKRAAAFSGGQLPGQSGQAQPGPAQPDARPTGDLQAKPALLPTGQPMAQPGQGQQTGYDQLANIQGLGRMGGAGASGGAQGGTVLQSGSAAANLAGQAAMGGYTAGMPGGGPTPRGQFPINPAQGGALSPNAWGALGGAPGGGASGLQSMRGPEPPVPPPGGGIRPMIPNESGGNILPTGQPMGGAAGGPSYGNDARARPMGGASGLQSMNGGGFQAPPGMGGAPGAPDVRSMTGGGFQAGPSAPPMASVPGAGDPDQVRQQAVARALAGRMAGGGGAFNQ